MKSAVVEADTSTKVLSIIRKTKLKVCDHVRISKYNNIFIPQIGLRKSLRSRK